MSEKSSNHPCFDKKSAGKYARIHLPLIKSCNIQCGYCNRNYSCPNENRPGVTGKIIKPEDVSQIISQSIDKYPNLNIVGIAGPGEALAEPDILYKAFKTVKDNFPELKLCLSTNGLAIVDSLDLIKSLKIDYITVTVNTLNPETACKIYHGADPEELIFKQIKGIEELIKLNIVIKINTVVIPGINFGNKNQEIIQISKMAQDKGVFAQNLMPFYPVKGSLFENIKAPAKEEIDLLRHNCSLYISQLSHCKRCRADAEGYLDETGGSLL